MSKEGKKKSEFILPSEDDRLKSMTELAEQALMGRDSDDSFENYTDNIKLRIYGNKGKFRRRFTSGYEVLLETIKNAGTE